jgi:hypothetical protein
VTVEWDVEALVVVKRTEHVLEMAVVMVNAIAQVNAIVNGNVNKTRMKKSENVNLHFSSLYWASHACQYWPQSRWLWWW